MTTEKGKEAFQEPIRRPKRNRPIRPGFGVKPGSGGAGSLPMTGGILGIAASKVKDFLDEIKEETENSKKNVLGTDPAVRNKMRVTVDEIKKMSPGEKKARFGKAFADGGVVDLTTEMVIDE